MTPEEMDRALEYAYPTGYAEPDERVRAEVILRQVIDRDNNTYNVAFFAQADGQFRPYAQRRLDELVKAHPELGTHLKRKNSATLLFLSRGDSDGSRALETAKSEKEHHEQVRGLEKITDADELLRISNDWGNPLSTYAVMRYNKVVRQKEREMFSPMGIMKRVLMEIYRYLTPG